MKDLILTEDDINKIEEHGLTSNQVLKQAKSIIKGFPFLHIENAASVNFGIMVLSEKEQIEYTEIWDDYLSDSDVNVVKMVPASGAASRMFKDLYELLSSEEKEPYTDTQKLFFDRLKEFPFYDTLNDVCLKGIWRSIPKLLNAGEYKSILQYLLTDKGLSYGHKPKGLIPFHKNKKHLVTPIEEHLAEGAFYTKNIKGKVSLHFTISPEHKNEFVDLIESVKDLCQERYGVIYDISYSEQQSYTDTIALDSEDNIFRENDGSILFRPAGHGALIHNLNDLTADVIFIKNIDNVVPDPVKSDTIIYKKILAGILIRVRNIIYSYLRKLDSGKFNIEEIISFMEDNLCIKRPGINSSSELIEWVKRKLNRPIRVCGMVRNEGEPGGGPFIIHEPDGSTSLQILESTQINYNDPEQVDMLKNGSYFNPVDIVCSTINYKGEKFDLKDFVNPNTAFVTTKSKDGKSLRALELPGLWNGAMHNWNTIFVEVPITTFNPVKVVTDLLRPEHQMKYR